MMHSYDLTQLDANTFEHMVNFLALKTLGAGANGFCPGADGGRDGYFDGEAPYPSTVERWSGRWYIQSKFHRPHLSTSPQKWLVQQIGLEIDAFIKHDAQRSLPKNWIVATNIEPSGVPATGAFDAAQALVRERLGAEVNFHIWGGRKILDFLAGHPEVATYYGHFLTPGQVLTSLYAQIKDAQAEIETIVDYLIVGQFNEQLHTKLDQAGSSGDSRPKLHELFIDLPFIVGKLDLRGDVLDYLCKTASQCHRNMPGQACAKTWRQWACHPSRARVWLLKGGPGQGKSTVGQYFAQIQRAALILGKDGPSVIAKTKSTARELRAAARAAGFWPQVARIPILIELKDFAQWFGKRGEQEAVGILSYLACLIGAKVEQTVLTATLKRALKMRSWFVIFDGLDEVPNDVKDLVAKQIVKFVNEIIPSLDADVFTLCTSRPQGYSDQFAELDGPVAELLQLDAASALRCAAPIVRLERSESDANKSMALLNAAIASDSVRELMTTPLQAHIMAVVVRDGGRPPERRWQLFDNFYQVMKKRESLKNFPDPRVAKLLREDAILLKAIHCRLGFMLHSRAESSEGAHATLSRTEFRALATQTVSQLVEQDVDATVDVLMEATTERLVFVSTPESGDRVRFDIRQLQEFFAAEFLYQNVNDQQLRERIELLAGDAHWREVMHFLLSALVENGRTTELAVAIEVLMRLNEGDGERPAKLFNKRMARGASLAFRLLQEGVLEQDKRVRAQFRAVLEPICGQCEFDDVLVFTQVWQKNARAWWINCLIDALSDASESENIGAAVILSLMLGDTHPRLEEVKAYLSAVPVNYFGRVVESIGGIGRTVPINNTWFVVLLVKFFLSAKWSTLDKAALNTLVRIIKFKREHIDAICAPLALGHQQIGLLKMFMAGNDVIEQRPPVDYAIAQISFCSEDWTTATVPDALRAYGGKLDGPAIGPLNGVFLICRFAQDRTFSRFKEVLRFFRAFPSFLAIMPRLPSKFFPLRYWGETLDASVKTLGALSEQDFLILLKDKSYQGNHYSRPLFAIQLGTRATLEGFAAMVADFPRLALHLWFDATLVDNDEALAVLESQAVVALVVALIMRASHLALPYFMGWGRVFRLAPAQEAALRAALRAGLSAAPAAVEVVRIRADPFKINLAAEMPFLPLFEKSLVGAIAAIRPGFLQVDAPAGKHAWMFDYRIRIDELVGIVEAQATPRALRETALVCLIILSALSPEPQAGDAFLDRWSAAILGACLSDMAEDIVRSTCFLLVRKTDEMNPRAVELLGKMMAEIRQDYRARSVLRQFLSNWRERSHAPVARCGILPIWLLE